MQAGYWTPACYTGNHRPKAFGLGYGLHVSTGAGSEPSHIVDIAPTILAILDVDPPRHFEGRAVFT